MLPGSAKGSEPIRWCFEYKIINQTLVVVTATANLAPGWHIYSQSLKEGGPMPTLISIESNDEIHLVSKAQEKGEGVNFFDSLYEMDIVWYDHVVSFIQPIQVSHIPIELTISLHYMTCNDHLCIPGSYSFSLPIKPLRRAP
ncbi:MAG TPA: protein-disulfide reductase DsbD family protein [Chryseolinea sp.]|nr:protein-disulfide reductase DsbD family protein [Chryseolinea sp.]